MRVLLVHPSPLMYSELYLRLEPLGLERVAAAIQAAGHEVRLLDLQVFTHADYWHEVETFAPQAVGFSVNYLANVPEVVDLAKETKARRGSSFVFVGGHSASFIAAEFLDHADGAIDCIVRGEGEVIAPLVLEAIGDPKLETLPGVVTRHGAGPRTRATEGTVKVRPSGVRVWVNRVVASAGTLTTSIWGGRRSSGKSSPWLVRIPAERPSRCAVTAAKRAAPPGRTALPNRSSVTWPTLTNCGMEATLPTRWVQ